MAKRPYATATKRPGKLRTAVAYMVAALPLVPAILVNVDPRHSGGDAWAVAAGMSIVMGAAFFECALKVRGFLKGLGFAVMAVAIFLGNVQNATMNASATSDHRSDHRKSAKVAAEKAWSQRSQWSQGRTANAQVAGEAPVAAIQAEVDRLVAADAKRWQATGECDPLKITAGPSREFCANVAELKAKLAAAQKRDELDAKIADLDAKREGAAEVPTVADPYTERVLTLLRLFGVQESDDLRTFIASSRDWTRAILLELMAVFGPSAILMLLLGREEDFAKPADKPAKDQPFAAKVVPAAASPEASAPVQAEPELPPAEDPIHGFIAACLEDHVGTTVPAGEMWKTGQDWYRSRGTEITQREFGLKLKAAGIAWDKNNNRPRYLNVRMKAPAKAEPALRVVAGTG